MRESKAASAPTASFWLSEEASFAITGSQAASSFWANESLAAESRISRLRKTGRRKRLPHDLSPVVGINVDVVFRQIAGPESSSALTLACNAENDGDIRIVEPQLHIGFIKRRGQPVAADLDVLQGDFDRLRVEVNAGIPRGREYSAPVGIRARD